ncbi:PCYCGC motif-containing (lipo)protein [Paenibacillus sp. FSL H8-0034]|uniref:PCYCGC motif-containing (lipo)protein n=1 Tax=Paenibacillus sp. FSL H8-0034 TaxID=2954671 RepID=UPI0038930964
MTNGFWGGVSYAGTTPSAQLSKDGKEIKKIQNFIDTQYNKRYTKPTDTIHQCLRKKSDSQY